ncbi:Xaa-Pro aminopeptidase [Arboricoccus pini]|uniref:Xaa-Pro aminopeptidase n=1 Tax=Arboricoccus pini TaxID=1963835 RepID=A0A212R217_9PROT|nr:aminopeptidase P family protein [Arboricoccus pini]SNB66052.1 Xaa-Pro aminopeptidase [Arboricoccus pini]
MSSRAERLTALRGWLQERGLSGFYLPRTDEFGSEYLPANAERAAWLTGFTGSAAVVVVLTEKAAVFSDGRYTVQLAAEVDPELFERRHLVEEPPSAWIAARVQPKARIGYDPMLMRRAEIARLRSALEPVQGELVALDTNPLDEVWIDRPGPPKAPVSLQDELYAGEPSAAKRGRIGGEVAEKGADALFVTAADSIAWLLNIRGRDIPFNPLCLSHLLLETDGRCRWFVDPDKLPTGFRLDNAVAVEPPSALAAALADQKGRRVFVDTTLVHEGYLLKLEAAGARLVTGDDPIVRAKARKNAREIDGAIAAQLRDGAAVSRFLAWVDAQPVGSIDELAAAERLLAYRQADPLFRGESFPAISAYGPNASLPHYRCSPETNRPLSGGALYLIDSGGQYQDATTDITRTVAVGAVPDEMKTHFTLVLKGHIAIDQALFPRGTTGAQIDALARLALWRHGLDFDHGTGHGIGAYLCVHEGPARISKAGNVPLEPGMILSNEPGFYKSGAYGIRIENLLLVEEKPAPVGAERAILGFRTLTLCPIDRRLIQLPLLSIDEIAWIDAYHARVLTSLRPLLSGPEAAWLEMNCARLGPA